MMAARAIQIGEVGGQVAAQITAQRQRHRWDQAQLAARVTEAGRPMSASVLGKVEAGTRRVDVDDLVALAGALEVSPADLLGEAGADRDEDEGERKAGPQEASVREDIEQLGDLIGQEPSLAEMAYALAREIDHGGRELGPPLTALTKELRATLKELWALRPAKDDDDDLDDLDSPE